jgi:hypothetical protein
LDGKSDTGHNHDHGVLIGLSDDDHTQYYNQARGDLRYAWRAHGHAIADTTNLQDTLDGKLSKTLTDTYIFVGNGLNVAAGVAMSGDGTMARSGALGITPGIQNHLIPCEVPTGAINDVNVTFTMANTPITAASLAAMILWKNGLIMSQGAGKDYTVSGNTITYNRAPRTGDTHYCQYWK